MAEPTDATSDGQKDSRADLLTELVAHLRNNRTQLRQEWARRIGEARLLTALTQEEIFSDHRGGAYLLFADGSVRFYANDTALDLLYALSSRDGGEVLSLLPSASNTRSHD